MKLSKNSFFVQLIGVVVLIFLIGLSLYYIEHPFKLTNLTIEDLYLIILKGLSIVGSVFIILYFINFKRDKPARLFRS